MNKKFVYQVGNNKKVTCIFENPSYEIPEMMTKQVQSK